MIAFCLARDMMGSPCGMYARLPPGRHPSIHTGADPAVTAARAGTPLGRLDMLQHAVRSQRPTLALRCRFAARTSPGRVQTDQLEAQTLSPTHRMRYRRTVQHPACPLGRVHTQSVV